MGNRTWSRTRLVMSMALVIVVTIALMLPAVSYAMIYVHGGGSGVQPQAVVTTYSNGVVAQSTPYGTVNHGGYHAPTTSTSTTSQSTSTQVVTITKTYTQTVYYTTVVDNYITKYMMPVIQWEYTLVDIGSQQQPGYHSLNHEELFLPGSGGSGIFVPVFATEAVYSFNYAPSTKPVITGWYVGSQSQSTSTSTSRSATPPQLTGIQQYVDNAQQAVSNIQQLATTNPNGLASTTYVYYSSSNTLFNTNTQYVTNQPPTPFYYSPQDIAVAYLTGNLYETQAVSDLMHGNVIGAVQSFGTALYNYGKGVYEQAYNFGAGVVNTLASFTYNPSNPQSIAHALSAGNVLNAITTGASMVWNALTSGWSKAFGFG